MLQTVVAVERGFYFLQVHLWVVFSSFVISLVWSPVREERCKDGGSDIECWWLARRWGMTSWPRFAIRHPRFILPQELLPCSLWEPGPPLAIIERGRASDGKGAFAHSLASPWTDLLFHNLRAICAKWHIVPFLILHFLWIYCLTW